MVSPLRTTGLHPYLAGPHPHAIAHRGGIHREGISSDDPWPENTMVAFAAAVDLGYGRVETDAHVTADGVLVAFHDEVLDRVTDRSGTISELTWSEVSQARVAGSEPIPLLEELMTTWPHLKVNIDPKADNAVEPLSRLLKRLDAFDRVGVGAFSDARLAAMRAQCGPDLCISGGPNAVKRWLAASHRLAFAPKDAQLFQVPPSHGSISITTSRSIDYAHRRGQAVHVWTIDEEDEMRRLLDLGVDGIITDQPAVLKRVLIDRGEWVD